LEEFLEVSHFLFDHRIYSTEIGKNSDSSLVDILVKFSSLFPADVDEQQISFFKELLSYETDESENEEIHTDTAVIQIKEMFPEYGNIFAMGSKIYLNYKILKITGKMTWFFVLNEKLKKLKVKKNEKLKRNEKLKKMKS